jgi:hypothetical protein
MNATLLELAEEALEKREAADIDTAQERELLADARKGTPKVFTAEEVKKRPDQPMLVAIEVNASKAYKERLRWTKLGFEANTRFVSNGYRVFAEWPS